MTAREFYYNNIKIEGKPPIKRDVDEAYFKLIDTLVESGTKEVISIRGLRSTSYLIRK